MQWLSENSVQVHNPNTCECVDCCDKQYPPTSWDFIAANKEVSVGGGTDIFVGNQTVAHFKGVSAHYEATCESPYEISWAISKKF